MSGTISSVQSRPVAIITDPSQPRWPVADKLAIRVNCQIVRRTFATLANDVGGNLKDIQTQMRHASATTADIYVQPIPRSVRESMEALTRFSATGPATLKPRRRTAVSSETRRCDIAAISALALVLDARERSQIRVLSGPPLFSKHAHRRNVAQCATDACC